MTSSSASPSSTPFRSKIPESMEDKENLGRVSQRAKRRAADALSSDDSSTNKKKRVVLGELPNTQNSYDAGQQKLKSKSKSRKLKRKVKSKNRAGTSTSTEIDRHLDVDVKLTNDWDSSDPQLCEAYASDIYEYLCRMETDPKGRPLDYIGTVQQDISASMRAILVDWLVEVAEEYKLVSDTLYLSISFIDRFLSVNNISRQKLQLLGVSALLIASKYEEVNPPHVEDLVYITDNTYNREEVVQMGEDVLKSLEFELGSPTIKTFLRRFTVFARKNYEFEFLGYYLAELSLLDYKFVKFLPSLVAASVVFLTQFIVKPKKHPWNLGMQQYTGYKPTDMKEAVLLLHDLYLNRRGCSLLAVREKYKQHKFKCVAMTPSPPEVPVIYFEDVRI